MSKSLDSFDHEQRELGHLKELQELVNDMYNELKPGGTGGNDYHDAWQVFGDELERLFR